MSDEIPDSVRALFDGTDALEIGMHIQGSEYSGNTLYIGARLVRKIDVDTLLHEMAHFVEIDLRRMTVPGWGLGCKTKVQIMGQLHDEPRTLQSTQREMRVVAYQANLAELLGLPCDLQKWSDVLRHVQDEFLVPLEDGTHPFSEENYDSEACEFRGTLKYEDIDKSRARWRLARIQEYRQSLTAGKFLKEWYRRRTILEERKRRAERKGRASKATQRP